MAIRVQAGRGWWWSCRWPMPDTPVNIHASCVAIGRRGILLLGASGAGKSEIALRLIDRGAVLVADDRTLLSVKNGVLRAAAPASIRGLIEIRGLGIVALPARASIAVTLVVRLGRAGKRLPDRQEWKPPSPLHPAALPPQIALDGRHAATPAKIRTALAAFSRNLLRDTFNPEMGNPK